MRKYAYACLHDVGLEICSFTSNPILLYGIGAINVDQIAIYRLQVAYRKIF